MKRSHRLMFAGVAAVGFVGVGQAQTTVNPDGGGANQNERCLVGNGLTCEGGGYDGAFSIIHALELDLGGSLVRVNDGLDQIWQAIGNQAGNIVGRARYAADTLNLGYDVGGGYQPLNLVGGTPPNNQVLVTHVGDFAGAQSDNYGDSFSGVANWTPLTLNAGTLFAFVLSDISVANKWTSNNSGAGVGSGSYNNSANHDDHMVTFKLAENHYVIAWEDRPLGESDRDYNDLVLEVKWLTPVPLPAALPLLLSGLLGFAGLNRLKRRV